MLKIAQYVLGAGLLICATAAPAADLSTDVADGVMDTCRAEYHQICPRVVPGDGRVARCLLDHEMELSAPCLQTLKIASAIEDCLPDYGRLCPGVPKGKEAFECLAGRIDQLMPACQRVVDANAPYMQPRGKRYSYNDAAPSNYGARALYSGRASYNRRDTASYDDREKPGDRGSYSYSGPPREPDDPYSYHYGAGYGGRYAGSVSRFRSYDGSDTGSAFAPSYSPARRAPY
jgi:hypothetical protein